MKLLTVNKQKLINISVIYLNTSEQIHIAPNPQCALSAFHLLKTIADTTQATQSGPN